VIKEVIKEPKKEVIKEPEKEVIKEMIKEPKKELEKEVIKEVIKEPKKEVIKEPKKEVIKEPKKEVIKELEKELEKEVKKSGVVTIRDITEKYNLITYYNIHIGSNIFKQRFDTAQEAMNFAVDFFEKNNMRMVDFHITMRHLLTRKESSVKNLRKKRLTQRFK
jgi:hypothetical protein